MAAHLVNEDEVRAGQTIRELPNLLANLLVPLPGDQTFFSEEGLARVSHGRAGTDWRSYDIAPCARVAALRVWQRDTF